MNLIDSPRTYFPPSRFVNAPTTARTVVRTSISRLLMAIAGVWLYAKTMRIISPHLPNGLPLIAAYLAAVTVVLASVLLYSGPLLPAVREALQEGALAPVGLLYLALARRMHAPSSSALLAESPSGWFWPCALGIVIAFLAAMGSGYRVA